MDMTMDEKILPQKVVIWGGCATRDAFPHTKATAYDIRFMARTSLASLASKGTNLFDIHVANFTAPPFEKRAFLNDFHTSWPLSDELADTDILIVDLTQERDGIFRSRALQSIITISEMSQAIRGEVLEAGFKEINGYTEKARHFDIFKSGLKEFKKIYKKRKARGKDIKLVLNQVYLALEYDDGSPSPDWCKRFNIMLESLYAQFLREMKPDLVVSYTESQMIARKIGHRWNDGAMHFVNDFYEHLPRAIWDDLGFVTNQSFGENG